MSILASEGVIVPSTELDPQMLGALAHVAADHINHEARMGRMNEVTPDMLRQSLGWFSLAGDNMLLGYTRLVDGDSLRVSSLWVADGARQHGVASDLAGTATMHGLSLGRTVDAITRFGRGVEFFNRLGFEHSPYTSPRGKFHMIHRG